SENSVESWVIRIVDHEQVRAHSHQPRLRIVLAQIPGKENHIERISGANYDHFGVLLSQSGNHFLQDRFLRQRGLQRRVGSYAVIIVSSDAQTQGECVLLRILNTVRGRLDFNVVLIGISQLRNLAGKGETHKSKDRWWRLRRAPI